MVRSVDVDLHIVRDIDPDDAAKIKAFFACDWTQAVPQSFCLNDFALRNMADMSSTLETSHIEMSPLKEPANTNISNMMVTLDTSHFEISPLKEPEYANMPDMVVTLDTSHLERSPLKEV